MTITYFVHSTSTDNENHVRSGWCDPGLSPAGREQASALGALLAGRNFDAVFSSDLRRAVETARLALPAAEIRIDLRLREMNYGLLNGRPAAEFPADQTWCIEHRYDGGENCLDVQARIASFIADACPAGSQIAVFSHKYPQLALEVICQDVSWAEAMACDWRQSGAWQPGWIYHVPHQNQLPSPGEGVRGDGEFES